MVVEDICIHPWEYQVEPFRIAGSLYYVGNSSVSSHLIDTEEGLILLDTAFPQTVYLLLESIRTLGFDPHDICYIIHCHGHYDHFGGTRALVELTGAETAMGEDDEFVLIERPDLSWAPEYGLKFHEVFTLDIPLHDGETMTCGNTEIECVHIPGHTPGSMAYFFRLKDHGEEYTVGIHGGPGLNTLTDEYLAVYNLSTKARDDYLASNEKLKSYSVDIFIGAHPDQNDTLSKKERMTDKENPFIDKEAWPVYLDQLEQDAKAAF